MKTVSHTWCDTCEKRGFTCEHDASKALGRARTHRSRAADKAGTRRGMRVENRHYECPAGLWHLTGMSRRNVRA
ncbi:hypothetical protein FHR83_007078 [Actinoplanes campanulatus]|uniref:Uncharacterized protein n=1 Tax=Actinoplanes campanulatus TaxID=113559 RepID=A0A7W5FIC0_9ACTN|nr:hypothetical protein [Actinoplanes campanulatus]GGN40247.1 hypothetical protein GCM10010109_69140 [Actinoplanes campanulatus]GID42419.1 hypothetical protein Aca09nite_89250 [Actinoplanes campanulatus]